jgi:hypothetical protein
MEENYSVNWYCHREKKEKTSFFGTLEEAQGFIDQVDCSPGRMVLEFNFAQEGVGRGNQ